MTGPVLWPEGGKRMTDRIENICVIGVGGVGGYFGGLIANGISLAGDTRRKITFIARGRHLEEIRRRGLILNTAGGKSLVCRPALAAEDIREAGSPDLVLVCVKSFDLERTVAGLSGLAGDGTLVLPLLNGVDIYERVRGLLARGVVLPACVYLGSHIESPGVVTQAGKPGVIFCGPDPRSPRDPRSVLNGLFREYGIDFQWVNDPFRAIWEKYFFVTPFALVTAYSSKGMGAAAADPVLRKLAEGIMGEIKIIAGRKGIVLPGDIIESTMAKASQYPPDTKTSYQRDVEARKGRNEGDLFAETIIKLGRALGVPVPITERVFAEIKKGSA